MTFKWKIAALIFVIFAVGGFWAVQNPQVLLNLFVPKQPSILAQKYLDDIRRGDVQTTARQFDPQYRDAELTQKLKQVSSIFPQEQPKSVKITGSNTLISGGATTYNFTFEYEFPSTWLVANIVLKSQPNVTYIEGLHIQRLRDSFEHFYAFKLVGKPPLFFLILTTMIFNALFTIGSAIVAYRSYIPKRKWLWVVFTLLAFGQFQLNWTTGQYAYSLVAIVLFGAGYMQSFYGPAILTMGFPLGAVIFWIRRQSWPKQPTESEDIRHSAPEAA